MIKETSQLQGFGGVKLPKLKGEVEIKLHNPTTGKTEVHKGENMITNAVYDIFASNYCGALNYNALLPLYSKMYGGIAYGSTVDKDYGWTDLTGTLVAGETTLTIQHEIITTDVTVEPYSDPFGINIKFFL